MDTMQLIMVGGALAAGAALQGSIGFGFGLLAIPLMIWAGVSMPTAVSAVLGSVIVQTGWNCWRHRSQLDWRGAATMGVFRVIAMPVGIWLMGLMVDAGQARVKQVVGVMLAVAVIAQAMGRAVPRAAPGRVWTPIAGMTSGLMSGLAGMGGPPLVLWVMAHNWPAQRTRSFLWLSFLFLVPLQLVGMLLRFGAAAAWGAGMSLAYLPIVVSGATLGAFIGARLSRRRLRAAVLIALGIIAAASILEPWL